MIISHNHKFIFLHNPKCAGTSFREAIAFYHDDPMPFWGYTTDPYWGGMVDLAHLRLWEIQILYPAIFHCLTIYNSLTFVRPPLERFISAFGYHHKMFRPDIDLPYLDRTAQIDLIERFMSETLTRDAVRTDVRLVHFSPQSWFTRLPGGQMIRHILPLTPDNLNTHSFTLLGLPRAYVDRQNRGSDDLSHLAEHPAVQDFVGQFYHQDFALFQSDPALASLTSLPGSLGETAFPWAGWTAW
ncbi:MAG: hypothetical protein B7Z78_12760 [Rhodospirillales bacterium 20-60-12]|nr:MAG: hypothetical protein B7Z78_12760 [Rhodospirillales bacterium 20-60-12]HQT67051.1 sulfotransferase family 2 domain-containing protein [Acetobacteraceae bacterium]HQU01199.1 sulfotransferase family 2 domain-containing protein [Acetobacteraceae bacterium]